MEKNELLARIEEVNDYTDISSVQRLMKRLEWLNVNDEANKPILEAARRKKLL